MSLVKRIAPFVVAAGLCGISFGETGMALIVKIDKVTTAYKTIWDDGPIMRIDLKDDQIINQAQFTQSGYHARFSPTGDKFSFLQRDNQVACVADLNGNILTQFTYYDKNKPVWGSNPFGAKALSWTDKGIYIFGSGRVVLFNETGTLIDSFTVTDGTGKVVGFGGRVASKADWAVTEEDDFLINMATKKSVSKLAGDGCGWGISPDGTHITQNRWDTFAPHATMGILVNNAGVPGIERILHVDSLLGLKKAPPGYVWNLHKWSGNNNDIFVMTVGPQQTQQGQIGTIGAPYICNYRTKYFKDLRGTLPENVVWTITDFYQGKVPGSTTPTVSVPALTPNGGSFSGTSVEVTLNCTTTDAKLHYTTNGTVPSAANGTAVDPGARITLTLTSSPLTLKVIAVRNGTSSAVVSGTYTGSVMFAPETPVDTAAGISFKYYRRSFTALPDFSTVTPDSSGVLPAISIAAFPNAAFGLVLEGYVRIPSDGLYTFGTNSNDGARLYIAGIQVVDNDGSRTAAAEKSGTIGLKQGWHKIQVLYFNQANDNTKSLSVSRGATAIPPSDLVYSRSSPLTLLSPNGGELFTVGSEIRIRWTAPENVTQVVLSLSTNGGKSYDQKITGTRTVSRLDSSWGNYLWKIPQALDGTPVCAENAIVLISNYQGPDEDESNAFFAIRGCPLRGADIRSRGVQYRLPGIEAVGTHLIVMRRSDERYSLELFTTYGAKLRSFSAVGKVSIGLDDLVSGTYLLRLRGAGTSLSYRFVVHHR